MAAAVVFSFAATPFFPRFQQSDPTIRFPAIPVLKSPNPSNIQLPALSTFRSRFGKFVSLQQERQRPTVVFASEDNSSDKDAFELKTNGGAQGPPLLTILAGLIVFLFVCWILWSIVIWLIGLIFQPPS